MSYPTQEHIRTRDSSISSLTVSTNAAGGSTLSTAGGAAVPPPAVGAPPQNKCCCIVCWLAICSCICHDRIYGSFFGPHPVNFMCCFCKCCCKGTCVRPFVLASIATKMMWFLMLFFIMLLSCFFIIPYPQNENVDRIGHFYPCGEYIDGSWIPRRVKNKLTEDCAAHGGYFMVYRVFLSYVILLFINCFIMIGVKSTSCSPQRAKIHHGFWFYKYVLLFGLLMISFLAIRVEHGGAFEYTMSWLGLVSSLVFSFIQLTLLLDIVELFITKNRSSKSDWADCFFWFVTVVVVLFDLFLIVCIGTFYLVQNHLTGDMYGVERATGNASWVHVLIYLYGIILSGGVFGVTVWFACRTKEYTSILRSLFLIAYIQGLIWGALSVSPEIAARPHYNVYKESLRDLEDGNRDTYFKTSGCFHGLAALLALLYYLFWHGPRSKKAPLSILFDRVWYWKAKKPSVPIVPHHLSDFDEDQFCAAVQQFKVWDDERLTVRYSWTIFYVMMILASFTLMMSMTNFSDPWAIEWYCSSYPAVGMKLGSTMLVTVFYFIVVCRCKGKVSPEEDARRKSLEKSPVESVTRKSDSSEQRGEIKPGESPEPGISAVPAATTSTETAAAAALSTQFQQPLVEIQ